MQKFSLLLSGLQAVIAARAARDRALTVLLVALHARIARMGTRLARLIALWRAGTLPRMRAQRGLAGEGAARRPSVATPYPRASGWLVRKLGYKAAAFGSQLRHLLTDAECAAFVAAVPQAGRILRPLLGLLTMDPLPAILRKPQQTIPEVSPVPAMVGVAVAAVSFFSVG